MKIHTGRAVRKSAKMDYKIKREQLKAIKADQPQNKWDELLASFEAGEVTWDDLTTIQKLSMPIGYQIKCKAAQRRAANGTT